ncbi:MAG TPA: SDR family oxidoreductase [Mycobacterium sp.]|nr:SDR family oxidoreductase [Mycobacterium sp.]
MGRNIDLTGKIAVVTGAGSGIGRATARLLAQHGAKIHVVDINGAAAAAVAAEIGSRATSHEVDVTQPEQLEALAEAVFAEDGRVDILHNNAGIGHGGDIESTTVEDWQRVIGVNLLGVAYGVQAFVPRLLAQGRPAVIVNTASEAGLVPIARMAPYCASKFGVVGMSESLDAELKPKGIRVIAVCPGIINTPIISQGVMRGQLGDDHHKVVAFYEKFGASPESVAKTVLAAIDRPRLIVPAPRSHVTVPWMLHRLSPRLAQPLARHLTKIVSRGGKPALTP